MSLGNDDSGVFQVRALESQSKAEVRIQPKPSAHAAPSAIVPPSTPPADASGPPSAPRDDESLTLGVARVTEVRVSLPPVSKPLARGEPVASEVGGVAPPAPLPPAITGTHPTDAGWVGDSTRVSDSGKGSRQSSPPPREQWVRLPSAAGAPLPFAIWRRAIRVSARKLDFPQSCPCCAQAADTTYDATHYRPQGERRAYSWTFPYCARCVAHLRSATRNRRLAVAAGVIAALLALLLLILPGMPRTLADLALRAVAMLITGVAAWWYARSALQKRIATLRSSSCSCWGPAVRYRGFYGAQHDFDFASPAYAEQFAALNDRKLVTRD